MASKKGGLGKGLDALMHDAGVDKEAASEQPVKKTTTKKSNYPTEITQDDQGTLWIDPRILKPNPHQPRTVFTPEDLEELSNSIREHGVVQPILIESAGNGVFYIIAGERRTRASILVGLEKVPVQLRNYSDTEKLEVALIENIQRSDLNPLEEAQAYLNLMQLGGLSQEEVAKRVGKQRSTVANAVRLLKLPEDMQSSLSNGQITAGHARALLSVLNPADQRVLFGRIVGSALSVREAEQEATTLNGGGRAAKKKSDPKTAVTKDPDIVSVEQEFINSLGTKVSLKGGLNRGSIVIDYFSRSDLDRLYNILTKKN